METKDLVGKTITDATMMKLDGYDDEGWLKLEFSDGTSCIVVSEYGSATGESVDEYPTKLEIYDDITGRTLSRLMPIRDD